MRFIFRYFKHHRTVVLVYFLFCAVFLISFILYHIPAEAVIYPSLVCAMLGIIFIALDIRKAYNKHRCLSDIKRISDCISLDEFPPEKTQDDVDYREIVRILSDEKKQLENRMNGKYWDMIDYYTVWVHQIKTPIASMRLNLQNEDSELSGRISEDLFRIEQYVEMVLMFLRLGSDSTDYVIKKYNLDNVIKQSIKKFAGQFIRRKIKLDYSGVDIDVITDEKWLSFVIEQMISNAVKYTPSGGTVSVYSEEPKILCIRDTGIGIAPDDLPRIFDKGYTGYNGRGDKKASGIGLYLCKRICNNLCHTITAESSLEGGTVIKIDLSRTETEIE